MFKNQLFNKFITSAEFERLRRERRLLYNESTTQVLLFAEYLDGLSDSELSEALNGFDALISRQELRKEIENWFELNHKNLFQRARSHSDSQRA